MINRYKDEGSFYAKLGENIKIYRDKKNFTQEQLAQLSHLSRTTITNIEKGHQKTPVYVVSAICYALEIELSNLIPSVKEIFGSKITPVEYVQVGDKLQSLSKGMADVVTRITKDSNKNS